VKKRPPKPLAGVNKKGANDVYQLTEVKALLRILSGLVSMRQVAFDYNGALRIVEVHAIGTSTRNGEFLVRGYQVAGESNSKPDESEGWRLFNVNKIENVRLLATRVQEPRPGYTQGDSQLGELLAEIKLPD
jgi:hypothetical protein